MEEIKQPRKSIWGWLRWVFWAILIFFISVGAYYWWVQIYSIQFSDEELKQAENALSAGITLNDPKDDFMMIESNDEKVSIGKASAYRLPEFDVKSLQVGADRDYFYYKVNYYGKATKTPPKINDDTMISSGVNFDVTEASGRVLAVLHTSTGWSPITHVIINGTYYSTRPTGIVWPENKRFEKENRDSKMAGGIGTDYQIGRFSLKSLGLKYGETMYFDAEMEGGSSKYSHAFADALLGTGKSPAMITWVIGANNYEINNNPQPYDQDQSGDKAKNEQPASLDSDEIVDFESCAKKFPIIETFPQQCETPDGRTYTQNKD